MSAFMTLALWACMPGFKDGFVWPKMVMVAVGMVLYWLRNEWRSLLFLAVLVASSFRSIAPGFSVWGLPGFWTYGICATAVYLVLMTMPTRWNWLKWAGVGLAVHAILQRVGLDPVVPFEALRSGRTVAWVGSPVDLGALLAMAAPVAGRWLPVVLVGMVTTGSRAPILGLVFAFAPKKWRIWMIPLLFLPYLLGQTARIEMIKVAWAGFIERPLLGQGPNTYWSVLEKKRTPELDRVMGKSYKQQQAHSDIAEALCSTGILGLLAYLILIWPLRNNPSLIALFVIMKFDPLGFETLCAAALIAANELKEIRDADPRT